MDDLLNLELLSLVSKVTSELQNHVGISDKTLAEFLIAQRLEASSADDFRKKLDALDAGFPPSLIESLDRLVLAMHPKFKGKKNGSHDDEAAHPSRTLEEKEKVFRGLALPDKQVDGDANGADAIDDTLALLEGLEGKVKKETGSRKRSRSPEYDLKESRRRRRGRSRSRSRDRRRKDRYRSRSPSQDRGDEDWRDRAPASRKDRRGRKRYDEDEDDNYKLRNAPPVEIDDVPQLNKIYEGHVTGVKDFGAFVNLHNVKGKVDGLVHVSRLTSGQRVNHPADFVSRGQQVWVKVTTIEGSRVGLSMKDVDQQTGEDLEPQQQSFISTGANMQALGGGRNGFMNDTAAMPRDTLGPPRRGKKRMTSPERWEIRQLIASGVAKASDYPDLEEEYHATLRGDAEMELEEDVDIEVREEEPPFLAGQTKQSLELSPIRVVKAPDGSMNRAAMSGTSLAKERRELKQQEAKAAANEDTKEDLSAQWNDPMADPDKRKFASDLRNARQNAQSEEVPEWKRAVVPKSQPPGKRTSMSIKEQRESLPVYAFRSQLIQAVRENQILIVVGETGSGKTTQLTQYLAEAGFTNDGMVGCTQPRRVAAMSVAKRVAEEVGCKLGEEVGYTIRFEDCTSPATRIKYMTDGMLQREILVDPDMKRYSCIMLDEAHERTIATDVLFALLKKALKRRPDLKVIVTSATLDADKFSAYFNECPIFTIPGRTFPVEILYSREPESDYLDSALVTVMQIHLTEPKGDILLFLTGQEEIDTSCEILYERMKALGPNVPELLILPVYAQLPPEMQSRIFEPAPSGARKVVIATNIAETSITIDGIYYVVDPGFVKQNAYDPKLGMDSLVVTPISQAQANQRAGRAGRTGPGKCFRLYTEAAYQSEMLPTTIPEIQRQNLANTILMLKAMGINDLLHFEFMDPPPINTMLTALEELYALSALDDEGLLTRLGRKMADFPMEPSLAKVLIAAVDQGCSDEVLSIVAMLNLNVFYRPKEKQTQADQKKAKFHDPHGDHLTLLNVYNSWKHSGYSNPWCFENFIQARTMRRAKDVREQLIKIMERHKHPITSCGRTTEKVRRALCFGFFRNAARKDPQEGYKTLIEGTPVYLHPSSALFGKQAEWVIYHTLVLTTKEYMHCTTSIEPKWLVEAAPTFFKVAATDRLSKRKQAERIQPLYNKFAGEDDWRLSAQRRGGRAGGGGGTWG
ncbi:Pre-mRNA-splicing factor ATP-dependent RNA helicase prp22 [Paramyrothecium foliicola]|nr:Pre-mRNA-splicing factor ATP-dependent RNA helicase prp22 [Paramyrothecium foliicola]